jgi:hydroxyacylglutathione hydrolase
MSWRIDCVVVGPIQCNCYILSDSISSQAYLIDPGAESEDLMTFLRARRFQLQGILITHAHIDHIGGIEQIRQEMSVPVYLHDADRFLFEDVTMQAQMFGVRPQDLEAVQPHSADMKIEHQQIFRISGGEVRAIHTPGHTPGSVCFHAIGENELVFTGDTLFEGSIGRTDLWGGSYEQIMISIRDRLMNLADRIQVLPGHGAPTTIGNERRTNPFLR